MQHSLRESEGIWLDASQKGGSFEAVLSQILGGVDDHPSGEGLAMPAHVKTVTHSMKHNKSIVVRVHVNRVAITIIQQEQVAQREINPAGTMHLVEKRLEGGTHDKVLHSVVVVSTAKGASNGLETKAPPLWP